MARAHAKAGSIRGAWAREIRRASDAADTLGAPPSLRVDTERVLLRSCGASLLQEQASPNRQMEQ